MREFPINGGASPRTSATSPGRWAAQPMESCSTRLRIASSFGYLAGVEVSDLGGLPEGFGHLEIPAQRYAVFYHRGHVSGIARTMAAIIGEWLPSSGHTRATDGADFFERYGEEFDPQTS